MEVRVRGVTCPKIYELDPPHGTPLTPRPQELTPYRNHHGTPALMDRFLDWFVIFLRDLVHFTSVREFFDLTPNVKERMAHLQIVFYQPKLSDAIPIVGTTNIQSLRMLSMMFSPLAHRAHPSTQVAAFFSAADHFANAGFCTNLMALACLWASSHFWRPSFFMRMPGFRSPFCIKAESGSAFDTLALVV